MRRVVTAFVVCLSLSQLSAQEIVKKEYFKDKYRSKPATEQKAKFVKVLIQNSDGSNTEEFRRTKDDFLISTETYKKEFPYGIWQRYDLKSGKLISEFNYEFEVVYSSMIPSDAILIDFRSGEVKTELQGQYKAPTSKDGMSYQQYLVKKIRYPRQAVRSGIQGTVEVLLTIDEKGKTELLSIAKGTNKYLDLEAARVINELPDYYPAKVNGLPTKVFAIASITFKLR